MSQDKFGFYKLAEDLSKQAKNSSNKDALYRTAISRAYYAVFLSARDFLESKRIYIPDDPNINEHKFVSDEIANLGKLGEEMAREITILRRQRNKADYGRNLENLQINAPLLVSKANLILKNLEKLK